MSVTLIVKDPKTKDNISRGFVSYQEKGKYATDDEYKAIINVTSGVWRESKILHILSLNKATTKITGIKHNGEFIPTKGNTEHPYIHRVEDSIIWSERLILKRSKFLKAEVVFEYNQKSQYDFVKQSGIAVIDYKGVISGNKAYVISGDASLLGSEFTIREIDPKTVSLRRV